MQLNSLNEANVHLFYKKMRLTFDKFGDNSWGEESL